jgi:hypothetical protein
MMLVVNGAKHLLLLVGRFHALVCHGVPIFPSFEASMGVACPMGHAKAVTLENLLQRLNRHSTSDLFEDSQTSSILYPQQE